MQGVFQALSKLLILWAEQRQNETRPWRLYTKNMQVLSLHVYICPHQYEESGSNNYQETLI